MELKIWKLHPQCIRVEPAEKTLQGMAHPDGVKYCGPFTSANSYGFWIYPPLDIDILWDGENFTHEIISPWEFDEVKHIKNLIKSDDTEESKEFLQQFGGRVKVSFGKVEPNICQMWTGVSFQTPPEWSLLIRSPINMEMGCPYRIQEGILECSWLHYDIWMNLSFQRKNEVVRLRRNQEHPMAQLVPVIKSSYDPKWEVSEKMFNRDDQESDKVYTDWTTYNYKKYIRMRGEKEKDSATYHRERAINSGKKINEPKPKKKLKSMPKKLIPGNVKTT